MAQAVHAGTEFCREYPELSRKWMATSNRVVILSASEEEILDTPLFDDGASGRCKFIHFFEPDLDNACTAVAVMPLSGSKYLTHLPLYGKV